MSSDPKAMVQKLWDFCDTEILVGKAGGRKWLRCCDLSGTLRCTTRGRGPVPPPKKTLEMAGHVCE